MRRIALVGALALALGPWAAARGSDRIGAYAVIDRVVLEPSAGAPARAQVWGRFCVLGRGAGRDYGSPVYGYYYYACPRGQEDLCRKEWADLRKVAGTGQAVGFGREADLPAMGQLRMHDEKPADPNFYPLNFGLVRLGPDVGWSPVKELLNAPTPVTPAEGTRVPEGKVTLVVRNVASRKHARATYRFEAEDGKGAREVSPEVSAGDGQTRWTPRMAVQPGGKYRWRVWAVDGTWKGPAATGTFEGKKQP